MEKAAERAGALEADVIVAGAGLVGPALALALARSGFEVALIDRVAEELRADPGFDGRAYAMALGSAGCLGALGLWRDLEGRAEPIRDITVSEGVPSDGGASEGGSSDGGPADGGKAAGAGAKARGAAGAAGADLHFDPRALDEARVGWILEDRYLRGALLGAVRGEPGIRHMAPAAIAAAAFEPGRAVLTLEDGRVLQAPLAVAADGRGSALAAMGGIGRQVLRYEQTGLVAAIEHDRPHGGRAHQSFFAGGPFAVLPLPGNRSGLVWSEREREAKRLMALDEAGYEAALAARIGPRLGRLRLAAPRRAFPLALELADAYAAPRLVLAGDAAHGVHPIAGQGLNMGLRDVAALVEVLTAAARVGEDIGDIGVLRRYERWRRFDNASLALGMDGLARLFSNANPLLSAVRQAGLRAVSAMPAATRFFMREAAGISGDRPAMMMGRLP
ncbi:MAG: UbiH/UbiF/VisC/COQ6 family ubiquinone biosynthesis hydroxylase [Pseudomonadota bacterium]